MAKHPLEDVIHEAIKNADGDKVTIGELLALYDDRSFGPIFTLLGLLAIIPPISAIPGLPSVAGAVILLFSVQMMIGHDHVWIPQIIQKQSIKRRKLEQAEMKAKPVLARIDRMITKRLTWATSAPARYAAGVIVSLLALALIPLELVPFAVALPAAAITMIGVALLARDGALMLLAFALSAAAFFVVIVYSPLGGWLGL
jgi:hypothetical protein